MAGPIVGFASGNKRTTACARMCAEEGQQAFWHSSAHILAQAVVRLFPDAKPTIGPAIEEGFYYDFDVDAPFTPEDIARIEGEMEKIIASDFKVERIELSYENAMKMFKDNPYKLEIIDR